MNFFRFALVLVVFLATSLSSTAFAIDLYVDTKTKQIFTEPGVGRVHLGKFKRDDSASSDEAPEAVRTQTKPSRVVTEDNTRTSTASAVKVTDSKPTQSNEAIVTMDQNGLKFKSADGNFKFKLGGRFQADSSFSGGDNFFDGNGDSVEANDGTEIRRARLVFKANFFKDWDYNAVIDFADNKVGIKDLNVRYKGLGFMEITAGSQKQPFSRELQESSGDLVFIERSVLTAITNPIVNRAIGLNLLSYNDTTTAQLGIYGDTIDANKRKTHADEGWSVVSRITHAPLFDRKHNNIINLGVSGNYREPNDAGDVNDKPLKMTTETTHMSNLKLVEASIKNVDRLAMVGGDVMAMMGPFSIAGEYAHIWIDRKNGEPSLAFNGWYGEAAWVLTGESRIYKKGKFGRIKPKKNFSWSNGTWGAWEVALRYGHVDLNHHAFKGGELDNVSVALNWYFNRNVRLQAGYDKVIDVKNSPFKTKNGRSPDGTDTYSFRAHVEF